MNQPLLIVTVTEEADGHALRFTRALTGASVRVAMNVYVPGDIKIPAVCFLRLKDSFDMLARGQNPKEAASW